MAATQPTGRRRRPTQRRSRQTVEAILAAAAQVFEERGYAGGTTNRIAERAGVSIGSLYQYFPDKDAVLVALMERHVREGTGLLTRRMAGFSAPDVPLRASLRNLIASTIEIHSRAPGLHRVLFEEAPKPAELLEFHREVEHSITALVEQLLRDLPEVQVPDPALSAYMVVHLVEDLVHEFVLHPPDVIDEARFADELVVLLEGYLTGARE